MRYNINFYVELDAERGVMDFFKNNTIYYNFEFLCKSQGISLNLEERIAIMHFYLLSLM
jgi:DNA-dependent RNA polymerase auxiliary subunit epsilon